MKFEIVKFGKLYMMLEAVQLVVLELGPAMEHFLRTCHLQYIDVYPRKIDYQSFHCSLRLTTLT